MQFDLKIDRDRLSTSGQRGWLTGDDMRYLGELGIRFYHGTTADSVSQVRAGGSEHVERVWGHIGIGGAYLSVSRVFAEFAATAAARLKGDGTAAVVVLVRPDHRLLPDEDWPACMRAQETNDNEYSEFMNDLLRDYEGRTSTSMHDWQHSLPAHYRIRYDELNNSHGITWLDSVKWSGGVCQEPRLTSSQILGVENVASLPSS